MSILSHNIYENLRTRTIVLHRGHVLLLPAVSSAPPGGTAVWRLPGGGLKPHETLAECARREVLEETGLAVRVGRIAFLLEWVAPRYAQTAESGNGYGFGLEVFHYATLEDPVPDLPEPRRERLGLIPPRWVPLAEVPSLPLWPKELKLLCQRLHEGRVPATGVSIIGRLESPLAVAEHDPFTEHTPEPDAPGAHLSVTNNERMSALRRNAEGPPMNMVFLYGPPGVGKLTVARELSALTGLKLFHNHLTVDLVGSVFPRGSPAFGPLVHRFRRDMFAEAALRNVDLIFTYVYAHPNDDEDVRGMIEPVLGAGGRVLFVQLTCSRATLLERVSADSRRTFRKLTDPDTVRRLLDELDLTTPMPFAESLRLDTTDLPPAEAAARIAAHYGIPTK